MYCQRSFVTYQHEVPYIVNQDVILFWPCILLVANTSLGNGFNVFVCTQLELQLAITFASLPCLHNLYSRCSTLYTRNAMHSSTDPKRNDVSIMSRAGSFISSKIQLIPLAGGGGGGGNSPSREMHTATASRLRPQDICVEMPAAPGLETVHSAQHHPIPPASTLDEIPYEQYVRGKFGPPAPPKDDPVTLDQYPIVYSESV